MMSLLFMKTLMAGDAACWAMALEAIAAVANAKAAMCVRI
jgi:hypothetical protein